MNLKYIIIGAVVVLLFIIFGRNPVEEGRARRAAERAAKGDPLVASIKEHNAKSHLGGPNAATMPGFQGNSLPGAQGSTTPVAQRPQTGGPLNEINGYYPPPPLPPANSAPPLPQAQPFNNGSQPNR